MQSYSSFRRGLAPCILILGSVIASCQGGPTSPEDRFALSASELVFSDQEQQQVSIKNLAPELLEWRIEGSSASWLNGTPGNGEVEPHGTGSVNVRIVRAAIPQGSHSATLRIGAGGQSRLLKVSVQPRSAPTASLLPNQLSFGTSGVSAVVDVANSGGTPLNWTLTGPSWVTISPSSGTLEPGGTRHVTLTAVRSGLSAGNYQGSLQLASNGGSATTIVSLDAVSDLRLDPGTLNFGTSSTRMSIRILNDGESAIDWSADPSTGWISLSPDSGRLPPKLSQLLTVEISRANLFHGTNQGAIQFSSNDGSPTMIVNASIVPAGGSNPAPSQAPKLSIAPVRLDFGAVSTELLLIIHNEGDQALDWTGDPQGPWISLPTASGRVAPHSHATVPVRISRTSLKPGAYQSFIQFESNGGSAVTTVAAMVNPPSAPPPSPSPPSPPGSPSAPKISIAPTSLDFGESATEMMLRVRNGGGAPLTWSAEPAHAWVAFPTSSGELAPGSFKDVPVRVSRTGLTAAGQYTSTVQFSSNGGNPPVPISVRVPATTPPPTPGAAKLTVTPTSLDFGESTTDLVLHLKNDGDAILTWSATASTAWLSLPVDDGQVAPGAFTNIIVRSSRTGLSAAGEYVAAIKFTSNGGNPSVPVSLSVPSEPPPPPPPGGGSPGNVNVSDFGARGDDLLDDSPAFAAALSSLPHEGGTLQVPSGTYMLSVSTGVDNLKRAIDFTNRTNITMVGAGMTQTILRMSAGTYKGDTHIVLMDNSTGITLRDLTVDGNRPAASYLDEQAHGVEVRRSSNIRFERVRFTHTHGDGIRLQGLVNGRGPWTQEIHVVDCFFEDNGRSGVGVQRAVTTVTISGSTFTKISDQAVSMEPSSDAGNVSPRNFQITNNHFYDTGVLGIAIVGIGDHDPARNISVTGNTLDRTAIAVFNSDGVRIENNTLTGHRLAPIRIQKSSRNIWIEGNQIDDRSGSHPEAASIFLAYDQGSAPTDVHVTHNTVLSGRFSALYGRDSERIYVTDNVFTGTGSSGTYMEDIIAGSPLADFLVENNRITGYGSGVRFHSRGDLMTGICVTGNSIIDALTPLQLSGPVQKGC